MAWVQRGDYYADSDAGYRICWGGRPGELRYLSWAPEHPDWQAAIRALRYGKSGPGSIPVKLHYDVGDVIPHPRECIGVYDDKDRAKQACNDHYRRTHGDTTAA